MLALLLLSAACADPAEGLRETPSGSGPHIVFDLDRRPLAEIPFPNDVATRLDPSSPTGRRLNVSLTGATRLERQVRARLNTLDGFGTFQPITVAFDAPLDLGVFARYHQRNDHAQDDVVFVVDIDPASPAYGRPVPLDLGRGNYPVTQPKGATYFPGDPRKDALSLVFETVDEDLDGDGVLDPGEDTDNDGVLDRPNSFPAGAAVKDGLMSHYERQTDTLIMRPLVPLRERGRYAVIITKRVTGLKGSAVRSPFDYVHHLSQTAALSPLTEVFETWRRVGIKCSWDDVAFAWVFSTQSVTTDLVALREGLYGVGPLGWLGQKVPADVTPLPARDDPTSPARLTLDGALFRSLATAVFVPAFGISTAQASALSDELSSVDYVVQGSFTTADLLTSPSAYIWDWTFDLDARAGRARVKPATVPFTLVIPKTTARHKPPFPVAIYSHGFGMARVEGLAFAGALARYGVATIGIEAWGHGMNMPAKDRALMQKLSSALGVQGFTDTLFTGRARDLDGDGRTDVGADTFSAYTFHSRDTVRQSVVDHLQLVRALRGFDGKRRWKVDLDGKGDGTLAGDFNGDGVVDAGGPSLPYFVWGSSMGGIHSGVLGAVEPAIIAAAPVAGGGALTYLTSRSIQGTVRINTVMGVLGPVLVGEPAPGAPGAARVRFVHPYAGALRVLTVGSFDKIRQGMRVRLRNLSKGRSAWATVNKKLSFNLHMGGTDVGDRFDVTLYEKDGAAELARLERWPADAHFSGGAASTYRKGELLRSPAEGWGYHRGSPALRRLLGLAQMVLDPADPVNYAPHFFRAPLTVRPEGKRVTNLLNILTLGDPMNPMDTHGAVSRAAGLVEYKTPDPILGGTQNQFLVDNWVYEGICGLGRFPPNRKGFEALFDPDRLDDLKTSPGDDGNGFYAPSPPRGNELRLTVPTATGRSGVRFAHIKPCGKHGFFITDPSNKFNVDAYLNNLAGHFFATGGKVILDDKCLETGSCSLP